MISSKEISVVVQGAIDKKNTPKCLESIRKFLPEAEIILSTWENSDVEGLDYDILVLNQDPMGLYNRTNNTINNVNRQMISTFNGIKKSSKKYILKIRSDVLLKSSKFLIYFDKFPVRISDYSIFKSRIIVSTLFTKRYLDNKSKIPVPFHISDWFQFGEREDIYSLWNSPLANQENDIAVNENIEKCFYDCWINDRYTTEQFIFYNSINNSDKYKNKILFSNMLDLNSAVIGLSEQVIMNNFILKSPTSLGCVVLKEPYFSQIKKYNKFVKKQAKCIYTEHDFNKFYKNLRKEVKNEN